MGYIDFLARGGAFMGWLEVGEVSMVGLVVVVVAAWVGSC